MKARTKFASIGAIALTAVSLTACTSTDSTTSTTIDNTPVAQTGTDPITTAFDNDYAHTEKMCAIYGSLVNQGWTNDEIYNQLNDAGAFDSSYGQGDTVWHKLIRWCYAN